MHLDSDSGYEQMVKLNNLGKKGKWLKLNNYSSNIGWPTVSHGMNENVKIALDLVLITTQMLFTNWKDRDCKAHKHAHGGFFGQPEDADVIYVWTCANLILVRHQIPYKNTFCP